MTDLADTPTPATPVSTSRFGQPEDGRKLILVRPNAFMEHRAGGERDPRTLDEDRLSAMPTTEEEAA